MDEVRKLKLANYVALGVVVLMIVALFAGFLILREQNSFSTEKWFADPENRTRIVDDLLSDYDLTGRNRAEVLALLGKPDNDAGYFQQEDRFVYWLGPERGLISIDSEWLILDFSGGVVTDCFITRD